MTENTRSSELDKILAEHWSDLRVVESGNPGTRSNAHKKAKRRIEALIASKVEEARIESERAGIYWVRNKVVTSRRDESGKFYLLDDAFVSEVDAYLEALQPR